MLYVPTNRICRDVIEQAATEVTWAEAAHQQSIAFAVIEHGLSPQLSIEHRRVLDRPVFRQHAGPTLHITRSVARAYIGALLRASSLPSDDRRRIASLMLPTKL